MAGDKILVLGGTGPTGINVLRELNYRKLPTVAYARSPTKIPSELHDSPYIEIIKGEFSESDEASLSRAIGQCKTIISLLGPNVSSLRGLEPTFYMDVYAERIFPLMQQHSVRRIFIMGTVSIYQPEDSGSFLRWLCVLAVRLLATRAWSNIIDIQKRLEAGTHDENIDWTVYRIALIPGGHDESSWQKDREGTVFVGAVGSEGWSISQRRGQLARWLVDSATNGAQQLIRQMPAVSRMAGASRAKAA